MELKKYKVKVNNVVEHLKESHVITCTEIRYDFKNSKISTGLEGVNRVFLPSSKIYPTLVASDTNDFVTTKFVKADTIDEFRDAFMKDVYLVNNYRKITKSEACRIQGFPDNFILPPTRPRWMKLIGNSVAVPVVKILAQAIVNTGVFASSESGRKKQIYNMPHQKPLRLFEAVQTYQGKVSEKEIASDSVRR